MKTTLSLLALVLIISSCSQNCPEGASSTDEAETYSMTHQEETYILNMDEEMNVIQTNSMARKMLAMALAGDLDVWSSDGDQLDTSGVRALLTTIDTIEVLDPEQETEGEREVIISQVNEDYLGLVMVNELAFDESTKKHKAEISRLGVGTPYTMKGLPIGNDVLFWLSAPE